MHDVRGREEKWANGGMQNWIEGGLCDVMEWKNANDCSIRVV